MKAVLGAPAQFEMAVIKDFRFLEEDGFSSSTLQPSRHATVIRYENGSIFVNLVYGPPAYEPEMSFGRLGIDDRQGGFSFEAGDLIQLNSCQGWRKEIAGVDPIEQQVAWLAALLKECGRSCLLGDAAVYAEMKFRRQSLVAEWQRDERARVETEQIDAAWKAKDYRTVIQLCSEHDGVLSNINQKRLEIAKEKI